MSLVADAMLALGALSATLYCFILSRRLARFTNLEKGMGGAVAMLSMQVDDLTKTLRQAHASARLSVRDISDVTARAEAAADRLELMMAALHEPEERPFVSRRRATVTRTRREPERAA